MPMTMRVEIKGLDIVQARLSNPEAVKQPIKTFLRQSGNVMRKDVRTRIPRGRTRKGRSSVRVRLLPRKLQVRVFSKKYYLRFLERGTKRGIKARHMFTRTVEASQPQVQGFANQMMRKIKENLSRGR